MPPESSAGIRRCAPRRPTASSFISTRSRIIVSGQLGVLAQREGHVLEHRQVGEERAELEQHAHAPAQRVEAVGVELVHDLAGDAHRARARAQLPADEAQQRGLAAAAAAHDRDHLAARHAHADALEDRAPAVGKAHRLDIDQGSSATRGNCRTRERRFYQLCTAALPYNRPRCLAAKPSVKKPSLLLVDDDPLIGESLAFALAADYDVTRAGDRAERGRGAARGPAPGPRADRPGPAARRPPAQRGLQADRRPARARAGGAHPRAHGPERGIECAPRARAGRRRPGAQALRAGVPARRARARARIARRLDRRDDDAERSRTLIGDSPAVRRLRSQIDLYAASSFPALIEGESGSGKERVAFSLHHLSPRAGEPFLALNCAAISPTLVEPTLFGYAKGAFTGAQQAQVGLLRGRGRRHALPRRDRRAARRPAGEAAARARERRVPARGRDPDAREPRAHRRRHQPRPARGSARRGASAPTSTTACRCSTLVVPPLRELGEDRLRLLDHYRALYATKAGIAAVHLRRGRARALARLRVPGQRARAEEHRDPPHHEVRGLHRGRGGARGGVRARVRGGARGDPVARARAELASRRARSASTRRSRAWSRPTWTRRWRSPRQRVAGGEAARRLAQHPLRPPGGGGTIRC